MINKEGNVLYFPIRNTVLYISFITNLFFTAWDSFSSVTEEKDALNSCYFNQNSMAIFQEGFMLVCVLTR